MLYTDQPALGQGDRLLHPARRRRRNLRAALYFPRLPLRRSARVIRAHRPKMQSPGSSSIPICLPAASFECSNALINQLQHNIQWGQKGNFVDIPTDCPQRDERLGWTGDAQVFTRTATFNLDVSGFFTRWLQTLEDSSLPVGPSHPLPPPWYWKRRMGARPGRTPGSSARGRSTRSMGTHASWHSITMRWCVLSNIWSVPAGT